MAFSGASAIFGDSVLINSPFFHHGSIGQEDKDEPLSMGDERLNRGELPLPGNRRFMDMLFALKKDDLSTARRILDRGLTGPLSLNESVAQFTCRTLLTHYEAQLPIFMFHIELGSASRRFQMAAGSYIDDILEDSSRRYAAIVEGTTTDAVSSVGVLEEFEFRLVQHLLFSSIAMTNCLCLNEYYPKDLRGPHSKEILVHDVKSYLERSSMLRRLATDLNCMYAIKFLDLLEVQIDLCLNNKLEKTTIDLISERYKHDRLMRGHMAVIRADSLLSPPWSSPLTLNIVPHEGTDSCGDSNLWNSTERNACLKLNLEAMNLYEEAYQDFEEIKCLIGMAAVQLRQACIRYGSYVTQEIDAVTDFEAVILETRATVKHVFRLFDKNPTWQMITSMHAIILTIFSSEYKSALSQSRELSRMLCSMGNGGLVRLVVSTLLRLGHQQLQLQRTDVALCLYKCAEITSEGTDSILLNFQSRVAQTILYNELSSHMEARVSLELHYEQFFDVIKIIDDKRKEAKGRESGVRALSTLAQDIFSTYQPTVTRVLLLAPDAHMRADWLRRASELVGSPVMQVKTDEELESHVPSVANRFDHENREQAVVRRFEAADEERTRLLDTGNFKTADNALKTFVQEIDISSEGLRMERLLGVFAYLTMGAVDSAKAVLDKIVDAELCNTSTQIRPGHEQAWSRSYLGTEIIDAASVEVGLVLCARCLDWKRAIRHLKEVERVDPGFFATTNIESVHARGYRLGFAGLIYENAEYEAGNEFAGLYKGFELLLRACKSALRYRIATQNRDSRFGALSTGNMASFFQGLARLCLRMASFGLKVSDLEARGIWSSKDEDFNPAKSLQELGMQFLEQGRARALLDSIAADGLKTSDMTSDTQHRKQLGRVLSTVSANRRTESEEQELQQIVREQALQEIDEGEKFIVFKGARGVNDSSLSLDLGRLTSVLPKDWLLISITYTQFGGIYFGVTNQGIEVAEHSKTTYLQIQRHAMRITYLNGPTPNGTQESNEWHESTAKIAKEVLSPFRSQIENCSHIVFSISDPLSSFPFGLLPFSSKPLFLQKSISQTPSLASFQNLFTSRPLNPSSFSIISRPSTLKEYQRTWEVPLPMACIEAILISTMLKEGELPIPSATVGKEELTNMLASSDIVQIGTHGSIDERSPWLSYLSLRERLRVVDLFGGSQRTQGRCALVVFAACLSGLGQATMGDDIAGFSHMILGSFAHAFLGSLWKVNDLATMLLMVFFYRELLACEEGTYIDVVWQQAQIRFYNLDKQGAEKELDDMITVLKEEKRNRLKMGKFIKHADEHLQRRKKELETMDFKDPFYWASFVMVGNAATKVYKDEKR